MSSNILRNAESLVLFKDVHAMPLCAGLKVTPKTLTRWATDGLQGPDGQVVRLEAIRVGSRLATSEPALRRFFAALTPNLEPVA